MSQLLPLPPVQPAVEKPLSAKPKAGAHSFNDQLDRTRASAEPSAARAPQVDTREDTATGRQAEPDAPNQPVEEDHVADAASDRADTSTGVSKDAEDSSGASNPQDASTAKENQASSQPVSSEPQGVNEALVGEGVAVSSQANASGQAVPETLANEGAAPKPANPLQALVTQVQQTGVKRGVNQSGPAASGQVTSFTHGSTPLVGGGQSFVGDQPGGQAGNQSGGQSAGQGGTLGHPAQGLFTGSAAASAESTAGFNAALPLAGTDSGGGLNASALLSSSAEAGPVANQTAMANPQTLGKAGATSFFASHATAEANTTQDAGLDANGARLARGLRNAVTQQNGSVTLRLTPQQLGTVRIELNVQGGAVQASLSAETDGARQLLQQQLGQLKTSLESQGLSVQRLDVQSMSAQQQSGTDARGQGQNQDQNAARDGRGQYSNQQQQSRRDDQGRGFDQITEQWLGDETSTAATEGVGT